MSEKKRTIDKKEIDNLKNNLDILSRLFLVFCLQGFRQLAGRNADEAKQNYFCGRKRICFASADFPLAEMGLGNECGRTPVGFFEMFTKSGIGVA